jgi:transposase
MDAVRENCCGLDVHQETVVACLLKDPLDKKPMPVFCEFGTTTKELYRLRNWLAEHECKEVVMESTGVLWKPVWNILESSCQLVVANARLVRNMPGRKTDMKDAQWLANLHRCGLIRGSMIPAVDIRDLRDLTRYRRKLVQAATAEKNRIHKVLQDANMKLTTSISDIFGVSGRAILVKVMNGEVLDERELKGLLKTKLKRKVGEILDALNGKLRLHHRIMISDHWKHLCFLEQQIETLEYRIDACLVPYTEDIERIDTVPGLDRHAAAAVFAEMGPNVADMFKTDSELASWAGVSPGNNESAGRKKKTKCLKGNKQIKASLCQAAMANRKSNNRIGQFFRRISKRRGDPKASVATAHLILRILYAMMRDKVNYNENDVLSDSTSQEKKLRHHLKQLQEMGYDVELKTNNQAS